MSTLTPIIRWYHQNKRQLPWRDTQNPYLIWLSEVILQQTRVEQGLPYFNKFLTRYPRLVDLANANDDEVMKLWQGLGYYNRAVNMLATARLVRDKYEGEFPDTYQQLLTLKGIGPYTAAAIASFAFNEAVAVVDGNVFRVLTRYFGIDTPINTTAGKKIIDKLAAEVLLLSDPATHNQAIMELGATVCKPKLATCNTCVLRESCYAYANNQVYSLPVKQPKAKPVNRYLNYFFIEVDTQHTFIRQRKNEGIWNNLFEFPVFETSFSIQDTLELVALPEFSKLFSGTILHVDQVFSAKHQLSHQTIYANFWRIRGKNVKPIENKDFVKVGIAQLHDFAVPRLLERFINTILL